MRTEPEHNESNPSGAESRSQNIAELQDPSKEDLAPKGAAGKPRLGGHLLVTSPGKLSCISAISADLDGYHRKKIKDSCLTQRG